MLSSRCGAALMSAALSIVIYGCAGTYAAEGAKQGAVAGAVAGAVGSLFWGGNVLESAAIGAVTTAAAGAAVGAMNKKPEPGGQQASTGAPTGAAPAGADEVIKRDRALEERIGTENFEAARLLGRCQHDRAIDQARTAFKSVDTDERRAYALMIEAVAAEEKGDTEAAASVYPRIVELAPPHGPVDKVRSEALSGILKVQQARKAHGLQPLCA